MDSAHRHLTITRVLVGGGIAVTLYLVAGAVTWPMVPLRILYEGSAPPLPYRWVRPPATLPEPNQTAEPGAGSVAIDAGRSSSTSVVTGDGQAGVIFRAGAIAPRAGATAALVKITALDPATIAPPGNGLQFDGNGYRVEAVYDTGGPVALRTPVTVVLRYPRHATALLRSAGRGWTPLKAHLVPGALQVFAASDGLGVFVVGAPGAASTVPWGVYVAVGAAVVGALVALVASARARRRPGPPRR